MIIVVIFFEIVLIYRVHNLLKSFWTSRDNVMLLRTESFRGREALQKYFVNKMFK